MQHLEFVEKKLLANDVWQYSFIAKKPVEYVPGQYARFTFPYPIADPRGKQHRTFSFTSHPSDSTIRFITRLDPPLSVFKQPLSELDPGATMYIDEPHGDAILPRLETTPIILIAQGIALASYLSMLQEVTLHGLIHPISLLWVRSSQDAKLASLIPILTFQHRVELAYPERLTVNQIRLYDSPDSLLYLSGSQTFVETLGGALEATGVPRERIIYDYYSGYADL